MDQNETSGLAVMLRGNMHVFKNVKISSLKKVYVSVLTQRSSDRRLVRGHRRCCTADWCAALLPHPTSIDTKRVYSKPGREYVKRVTQSFCSHVSLAFFCLQCLGS